MNNKIISNCNTCEEIIFHKKVKVDNKTYNKNTFIFYNNESKTKSFCSIVCKMNSN